MTTAPTTATDFAIADGAYGAATPHVRSIVETAKALRWFPTDTPRDEEIAIVRDLLTRHLVLLIASDAHLEASRMPIEVIHGGWDVLAAAYRAANPITPADDPAYARGEWRTMLGATASRLQHHVEKTRASLIVPPLFPFVGKAMILGGMLTADPARGATVVDDLRWRETVWYLMCDVDSDFWNAIMAVLATEGHEHQDPFGLLVDIYSRGFYPIGFVGERFVLYYRA